jgi:hypothetical protein
MTKFILRLVLSDNRSRVTTSYNDDRTVFCSLDIGI